MSLPREHGAAATLARAAIDNYRLVLVGCTGVMLMAALLWNQLPRSESPQIEPAEVIVTLAFPGASASEVEQQVLRAVEPLLLGLQGIEWVESSALAGLARLHARFADGTDMPVTYERIRGVLLAHRDDWPAAVLEPQVHRLSTDLTPSLIVSVSGYRSNGELSRVARDLQTTLLSTEGVVAAVLWGERNDAVTVKVDSNELSRHHLGVLGVVEALKAHDVRVPAGIVRAGKRQSLVTVEHRMIDAASVGAIPVATRASPEGATEIIRLRDVAQIQDGVGPARRLVFQGSAPAVALEVRFRPGANPSEVERLVDGVLARKRKHAPAGVSIVVSHSLQDWTQRALSTFWESLLEGILLVLGVITLGLGVRAACVVSGVLPLAVCGAVIGLYAFGFGIDQISLAGLIVALGLLVDDAVVVTESIVSMRARGVSPVEAAVAGTARVFRANNGTTAIACAAFFPLFFMGGMVGAFIRGLPASVIFALLASLLVAQTFTPWAATRLLKHSSSHAMHPRLPHEEARRSPIEHSSVLVRPVQQAYRRLFPWVASYPWAVAVAFTALWVASLGLFPMIGVQFFPKADKPAFFVTVEMPRGTRLAETAKTVHESARIIESTPGVRDVSAVAGQGYPEVFYGGRVGKPPSDDYGDIFVRVDPGLDPAEVANAVRARVSKVSGARVYVDELWTGTYVAHPISLRIFGEDYEVLRAEAKRVAAQLRKTSGAVHVSYNMETEVPAERVAVSADSAMRAGLSPVEIARSARALYGQDAIVEARDGTRRVDIVVESPESEASVHQLASNILVSRAGAITSLGATASLETGSGVVELMRRNSERMVEITADLAPGALLSDVMSRVQPWVDAQTWPEGYRISTAGAQEETETAFQRLGIAALFSIVVIAVVLVWMFDSFALCGAVLLALPYGISGALFGLWATGNAFGFTAFLGMIALLAVYVNHKVYFIDAMLQHQRAGMNVADAIFRAGLERVPPVVLTALTALLSLLPLGLFGGPMWSSFAWANIFGLLASIPLSLILLPALIILVQRARATLHAPVQAVPVHEEQSLAAMEE